ncbi:hypothetical protein ElyMa_006031400 [Elysia marginata]|uniref:Uncharacterized protein n=1 Tax=Elysia marginata TaxID=1093978 RepID=A0AAV4GJU2_9GAST|nr:hypothetical protein ElyMa_006031400 [Elysia marginata]
MDVNNSHGQFLKIQLHPKEIDQLDVPVSPGVLFKMFFTPELVASICDLTNENVEIQRQEKPSLYKDWVPLN